MRPPLSVIQLPFFLQGQTRAHSDSQPPDQLPSSSAAAASIFVGGRDSVRRKAARLSNRKYSNDDLMASQRNLRRSLNFNAAAPAPDSDSVFGTGPSGAGPAGLRQLADGLCEFPGLAGADRADREAPGMQRPAGAGAGASGPRPSSRPAPRRPP